MHETLIQNPIKVTTQKVENYTATQNLHRGIRNKGVLNEVSMLSYSASSSNITNLHTFIKENNND